MDSYAKLKFTKGIRLSFRKSKPKRLKEHHNFKLLKLKHTIKFSTIYLPSSIKNFSLKALDFKTWNSKSHFKFSKILIKQSYLILVWLRYISKVSNSFSSDNLGLTDEKVPMFFIYPARNYKFTMIKAPMAHKTYSQEQFICRIYKLSITFYSYIPVSLPNDRTASSYSGTTSNTSFIIKEASLNKILYLFSYFFKSLHCISTGMFFLQRYTLGFKGLEYEFLSIKFLSK